MKIWDTGTYDLRDANSDEMTVILHGKKLHGPYALVRMVATPSYWLLIKMKEPLRDRSAPKRVQTRSEG